MAEDTWTQRTENSQHLEAIRLAERSFKTTVDDAVKKGVMSEKEAQKFTELYASAISPVFTHGDPKPAVEPYDPRANGGPPSIPKNDVEFNHRLENSQGYVTSVVKTYAGNTGHLISLGEGNVDPARKIVDEAAVSLALETINTAYNNARLTYADTAKSSQRPRSICF